MIVTKEDIKTKILAYLNNEIKIDELVDWAENMIKEADYEEDNFEIIKEILFRLGVADIKEFGLTWEDCYNFLSMLGYKVKVYVTK